MKLEDREWIKFQDKYKLSIVSLGFFIFELLIFTSIVLGIFYVWYVTNYFTLGSISHLFVALFEVTYIIMTGILLFLCVEEIRFDRKFPLKRRYNGYLLLTSLILFNSQYLIFSVKIFFQTIVDIYDIILFTILFGIGLFLLFIILLRSIFAKIKSRIEIEESIAFSRRTQTIFYLSHISFIIATVCLVIVALNGILVFSFKGSTIFSGQAHNIWSLWNWWSFLRNMLILLPFVVFFLFVEIRYDLFFDFDDNFSGEIKNWFSRIFRR
jgi:hypothetical protein